jgi:hypothetical protein
VTGSIKKGIPSSADILPQFWIMVGWQFTCQIRSGNSSHPFLTLKPDRGFTPRIHPAQGFPEDVLCGGSFPV